MLHDLTRDFEILRVVFISLLLAIYRETNNLNKAASRVVSRTALLLYIIKCPLEV